MFDKNNSVAYKTLQELQKESEKTDFVYPYMDRLSDMLDSDDSYIRTRRLTSLAYNAKWDKDYKIDEIRPPFDFTIPKYKINTIILYFSTHSKLNHQR